MANMPSYYIKTYILFRVGWGNKIECKITHSRNFITIERAPRNLAG